MGVSWGSHGGLGKSTNGLGPGWLAWPPHDHGALGAFSQRSSQKDGVVCPPIVPVRVSHSPFLADLNVQDSNILEAELPVEAVANRRRLEPAREPKAVSKVDSPLQQGGSGPRALSGGIAANNAEIWRSS